MKQIVIDYSEPRIRTALVDDGRLVEVIIDDPAEPRIIGNIYLGLVSRVLPNGFAFIDIGREHSAFMDLNGSRRPALKQGDRVLIQVVRDMRGGKGAIASTELCFAGKYAVVCRPSTHVVGVSKKIEGKAERKRLKRIVKDLLPEGCGLIIRTGAAGVTEDVLTEELHSLLRLSDRIAGAGKHAKAPSAVYEKSHPLQGTLQALLDDKVSRVIMNAPDKLDALKPVLYAMGYDPALLIAEETPDIFKRYDLSAAYERAFDKRVWLKSGGYIIIEHTEACVVIDVNTGKSIRKASQFTTNCEAAVEIATQLRLRNLCGMIIIDFIDMKKAEEKRRLHQILEQETKKDRVRVNVVGMTELGLMQLTRKRTGKTLGES